MQAYYKDGLVWEKEGGGMVNVADEVQASLSAPCREKSERVIFCGQRRNFYMHICLHMKYSARINGIGLCGQERGLIQLARNLCGK